MNTIGTFTSSLLSKLFVSAYSCIFTIGVIGLPGSMTSPLPTPSGLDSSNRSTSTCSSSSAAAAAAAFASYFALSSAIYAACISALDGPVGTGGAVEVTGGGVTGGGPFLFNA